MSLGIIILLITITVAIAVITPMLSKIIAIGLYEEEAGLDQLVTDICNLSENPGSFLIKMYVLEKIEVNNGYIRVNRWVFCACCRTYGEEVFLPVIVNNELELEGLVILNLTSTSSGVVVTRTKI